MLRTAMIATITFVVDNALGIGPLAPSTGRRMEQAILAVREALEDGRMKPGVKYSVYQLAEALGISRTPVRDALLRLESAGVVKFEARQGFRFLLPQPREIAEIFAVRLALEIPAVRAAAMNDDQTYVGKLLACRSAMRQAAAAGDGTLFARHDVALHDLILEMAGNSRAQTIVMALRESIRLLDASTADRSRTLDDIDAEHDPIVDAIVGSDPHSAEQAMRHHVTTTGRLLVRQALGDTPDASAIDEVWSMF